MEISRLLSIAVISLLGAMSPGPDFAMVTKNCLNGSFRKGVMTTLGIASALSIHISYSVFGIAVLIYESPVLFHILKYLGAGYLFYLGIVLLREKGTQKVAEVKRGRSAFVSGFLCNLLNPKATLFIFSLFTQFIDPSMGLGNKTLLGLVILAVTLVWFIFLSYIITHKLVQKHFARFQFAIGKVMGFVLCFLALYIALQGKT
jgi:RhtB (resistance to homoserine/threonine) family protein